MVVGLYLSPFARRITSALNFIKSHIDGSAVRYTRKNFPKHIEQLKRLNLTFFLGFFRQLPRIIHWFPR